MSHDDDRPREPADDELDALLADAFAQRGELVPTTSAEVRAAERDGVAFEGELPPELAAFEEASEPHTARPDARPKARPAASQRVVSIEDLRRARDEKSASWWTHAGTFALGVAVAAGTLLYLRAPSFETARQEPAGGPAGSASAAPEPAPRVVIPAVQSCRDACCAGSSCATAQGELRACTSGRTCVGCGDAPEAGSVYRVRMGSLSPTPSLHDTDLAVVDLCVRVGGSAWSCEPAYADPTTRAQGRTLLTLVSVADVASGIELELRARGSKEVMGRWRDAVRLGPTALCRGVGALIANEKQEHLGSVSLFLDDAHYVELARAADVESLRKRRAELEFDDVTPQLIETTRTGAERYALTVGPLSKPSAERLRWELLERSQNARVLLGEDYAGASKPLR